MSFTTQADRDARIARQNFQKQVRVGLDHIYVKYPTLRRCEATDKMICDLVTRFVGEEVVPTLALFELARQENPGEFRRALPTLPVAVQKSDLIEEICALLRSPDGSGRGGRFSDAALRSERVKMASWNKEALRTRLATIQEEQRLAKMTPTEIREELKSQQVVEAVVLPAEYTADRIKHRMSSHELKYLIARFGLATVNDRIQGRS